MPYSLPDVVFLFFIYSFIGWLWETVYCSIKDRRFDYRGFLFG
ncbi:putative ABC transporter permease, partial [Streptococcus orisasini]